MTYFISPCNVSSCINFTETGEWRADIIITELRSNSYYVSVIGLLLKVEIFLEQREVAFLSTSKICENLNFLKFFWVIRTRTISVLKLFLLYLITY